MASFFIVRQMLNIAYLVALYFLAPLLPLDRAPLLIGGALGITIPMFFLATRFAKQITAQKQESDTRACEEKKELKLMGEASEVIIPIGGIPDITGEVIMMWVLIAVLAVISLIVTLRLKERPGMLQNIVETDIEYLDNFFTGIIGRKKTRRYSYFLGSLFVFIIFSNYSDLLPGVGLTKHLKSPTASLSVTLGLGVVTFVFLQLASA